MKQKPALTKRRYMRMKTTVHIISHSHWDREWYMAFEKHRMKLVELIDDASELLENDPEYRTFHMDGHTIPYEDYFEIKPEKREDIKKLVQEGKFTAGPWYVLQDEFLTSGEACVRNLLTGRKEAQKLGKLCTIGYFPDAFGNAGQMPQVLAQAGMEAVAFGRGVKPVGLNNMKLDGGAYDSAYSEMNWQSPDGTSLLGILFANWYNNGMEIPADPEEAKRFWDQGLADARRFAGTGHLLFMNGCDHQPVQKNLTEAIETARSLYPDIEFIHSDFETYVNAVKAELGGQVSTVKGELTSQETDGRYTLINTASSRIDLKMKNREGETALERKAEPAVVLAALAGGESFKELLDYSWRKLMQNHPHDSICSCDVDEVNDEVALRYEKSRQVAEQLCRESMEFLSGKIDTQKLTDGECTADPRRDDDRRYPFVVFNTGGWERTDVVQVVMDVERCFSQPLEEAYWKLERTELPSLVLKDDEGNVLDAEIEDIGTAFGYLLPNDRFRQPYMARQVRVTFEADAVPPMGYRVYQLTADAEGAAQPADMNSKTLVSKKNEMENEALRVVIHADGSYTVKNKKTGYEYAGIGYYEDTGDVGNEYIYIQDQDGKAITTKGGRAEIRLVEDTPFLAKYVISQSMEIPESAAEELEISRKSFQNIYDRRISRSRRMTRLSIVTELTLGAASRGLRVNTTICNTARDHRVRVMIPTGLDSSTHFADSAFEVVERNNHHSPMWENPCGCDRDQSFVGTDGGKDGMLIANRGLYEYEILPDQKNTIAVTLLRCVGEMGDWGYFPSPKAQMLGTYTMSYEIIPFAEGEKTQAYTLGYQFQNDLMSMQTGIHNGNEPLRKSFFTWSGEGVNLSCFKHQYCGEDVIVRFVNVTGDVREITVQKQDWMETLYFSNVVEEEQKVLEAQADGNCYAVLKPYEILTIGIKIK